MNHPTVDTPNGPLMIRPETPDSFTCDHALYYIKGKAPYFDLQLQLLRNREIERRRIDNRSQAKQTPNTAGDWDDPNDAMLPGPWTLVGSVALGVVAWAVWGIVKMLKP